MSKLTGSQIDLTTLVITESQISDLQAYITDITGEPLSSLSDVTISTIASGEILKWNGSAWVNNTLAEAGISPIGHVHATTDITSGTFADARIAQSNVTQHQAALTITESQISDLGAYIANITGEPLSDLSDVTITSIASGEILQWNGSAWINRTFAEADIGSAAAVALNTAKVSNATHTGEVTGATTLTVDPTAISGKTLVTAVGSDHVLILDATDGALKKALISDFASVGGDMAASTYDPAAIAEQLVGLTATQTLTNKTLTSAVLTSPQINDTSADHQYIFAVSELIADRTVTLPLLTGNDTFVFEAHSQTLTNKTIDTANNTITIVEADISDLGAYITGITGEPLSDLSDVIITSIASGELLKWNGSSWVNNTLAEAGIAASTVEIQTAAGSGLSGGGDLSATRSLAVDINSLTEQASPGSGDYFIIYDAGLTALRKVDYDNLPAGGGGSGDPDQWESNSGNFQILTSEILSGDRINLISRETDGADQVAHVLDTENAFSNTDSRLVEVYNNGTEKWAITEQGNLVWIHDNSGSETQFIGFAYDTTFGSNNVNDKSNSPFIQFTRSGSASTNEIQFSPHPSDAGFKLKNTSSNTVRLHLESEATDSASTVAWDFDTENTISTSGAVLFRLCNNGTVVMSVHPQGHIQLPPYGASAGNTAELRMYELTANGSNYTGFKAPDSVSDSIYTMPGSFPAANSRMQSTTGGVLSWVGVDQGSQDSKSVTLKSPSSSEDVSLFFSNRDITITEMRAVVRGTSPSVTWTIRHGPDRSATGTEVVTSGTITTSQATGSDVTSFNDATIPADSFIWFETTATSGTVDEYHLTMVYTVD